MLPFKAFFSLTLFSLIFNNSLIAQQVHDVHDHLGHTCAAARVQRVSLGQEAEKHPLQQAYDVGFYFLDLEVTSQSTSIRGKVEMHAQVIVSSLDTIVLDMESFLNIDSVKVNGSTVSYSHASALLKVILPGPASSGSQFIVSVYYHGQPSVSGFFSGISSAYSQQWGKRVTWTLSEPFNARQWWPCKQDLGDKADSAWIFLTTDSSEMAGSNGLLTNIVPQPNGKVRYEWKTRYPIAYYLISFAVADYMDYSIYAQPQGHPSPILIQNFIYNNPANFNYYKASIDETADMLELYSELMGLYPFHEEKYGHCQAQLGGGMEHQTMSTMGDFNTRLNAHEIAHQWFGNNVTCATWSDIFINEGFATYSEYLALEFLHSLSSAANLMQNYHASVLSSPGGSIYVPPAQVFPGNEGRIFSGRLSYHKGAVLLHMLRWELQSDSLFFAILKSFQQVYANSVATGDDFLSVVNAISGKDYTWFFDQWYYGEGYPTYHITWRQEQDSLIFTSTQVASTSVTSFFRSLMEYRVLTTAGDTLIVVQQDLPVQTYAVTVSGNVVNMFVDPRNHVLNMPGSVQTGIPSRYEPLSFRLYPNPSKGLVTLDMTGQDVASSPLSYQILDIRGRVVHTGRILEPVQPLETTGLPGGIYLVKVSAEGWQGIQRMIIQ